MEELLFDPPFPFQRVAILSKSQRLQERLLEDARPLLKKKKKNTTHAISNPHPFHHGLSHPQLSHHGFYYLQPSPHGSSHLQSSRNGSSHLQPSPHGFSHPSWIDSQTSHSPFMNSHTPKLSFHVFSPLQATICKDKLAFLHVYIMCIQCSACTDTVVVTDQ